MEGITIGKDGFALPQDLITSTQAILARKRRGKTYTASVEAEGMLDLGAQIAAFDPTGAWWGIRAGANGDAAGGYPVTIFGGDHADAALDPTTGKAMAAAMREHGFSAIFDLSKLDTADQWRFVRDFTAELLRANNSPIHLFIDEADTFAPQTTRDKLQFECLGTVTRLVKQGGIKSIGVTLITQRAASLSWDVLSQIDMLTVLAMTAEVDTAPVVKWMAAETSKAFADEAKIGMPRLNVGQAIIASANFEIARWVDVRQRKTFNSGRTVKFGENQAKATLAPVDAAKLGAEIAQAVQKAKDEDPEALKARVQELEQALREKGDADVSELTERIEQLEATAVEVETLRADVQKAERQSDAADKFLRELVHFIERGRQDILLARENPTSTEPYVDPETTSLIAALAEHPEEKRVTARPVRLPFAQVPKAEDVRFVDNARPPSVLSDGDFTLNEPQRKILDAIATLGAAPKVPFSWELVAVIAGTTARARGFEENLRLLKKHEYIIGNKINLAKGYSGKPSRVLPTLGAVVALYGSLLSEPQRKMLLAVHRTRYNPERLAALMETTVRARGFEENLRQLIKRDLMVRKDGNLELAPWLNDLDKVA